MIKISKVQKPQILVENAKQWTEEYLAALEIGTKVSDTIRNRYRNEEIKKLLKEETHGKCAYCESKILGVTYGDIEHILPKSKKARPDLYVEWENLTLACEICNRDYKHEYYEPNDPLINPIIDNPEQHLIAVGPFIYHRPGSRKGELTVHILGLNRSELWQKRKERIDKVLPLVDKFVKESNPKLKDILKEQIELEISEDTEYSFVVRSTIENII